MENGVKQHDDNAKQDMFGRLGHILSASVILKYFYCYYLFLFTVHVTDALCIINE